MTIASQAFERLLIRAEKAILANPALGIYRMSMGAPARGPAPIPEGAMRVAPGSDAVVWRVNSDKCGEL